MGFKFKIEVLPEFQCVPVHKKDTIQKQATLGLPWTLEGEKVSEILQPRKKL